MHSAGAMTTPYTAGNANSVSSNFHLSSSASHNKFDQTFNVPESILPGGHILHITLWNINFQKQQTIHQLYTLRLDGQKYSQFDRIYELGYPHMMEKYKHSHVFRNHRDVTTTNISSPLGTTTTEQNHNSTSTSTGNSNHHANGTKSDHNTDPIVRGRPRYEPRRRSHTADNNHNHHLDTTRNPSSSYFDNMHTTVNIHASASDDIDHYWERPPKLPTSSTVKVSTSTSNSPKHRKRFFSKDSGIDTTTNVNNWKQNLYQHDCATNDYEEKEYITKAKLRSFRDLRGDEQSYDQRNPYNIDNHQHGGYTQYEYTYQQQQPKNDDNDDIPTFAKPPRSTPANIQTKQNMQPSTSHNHGIPIYNSSPTNNHEHSNLTIDLLDDNNNKNNNNNNDADDHNRNNKFSPNPNHNHGLKPSISVPTLVRSTSDITLDTMLRDLGNNKMMKDTMMSTSDGMSVVTQRYAHLDPMQMSKTQQQINFRLQNPPVYADSLAGDLIQPQPSFGDNAAAGSDYANHNGYGSGVNGTGYNGTTINSMNNNTTATGNYSSNSHLNIGTRPSSSPQYHEPMSFTQQKSWVQQQQQPSQQPSQIHPPPAFNPAYNNNHQHNVLNFAGRHMYVPMQMQHNSTQNPSTTNTATVTSTASNLSQHQQQPQQPQQQQQEQPSPKLPIAPPAPTWDMLQNAFPNTPRHQNHKKMVG